MLQCVFSISVLSGLLAVILNNLACSVLLDDLRESGKASS